MPIWPLSPPALLPGVPDDETEAQGDAYGVDVYFDGQHRVGPDGDYLEVAGIDNLRRAIFRRLITRPGEYRLNPKFGAGVPSFVKKPRTKATIDELTNRIKEQLKRDRRIQRVVDIVVTYELFGNDTGIRVLLTIQAFGRTLRPMPFDFTKEA